jgi:hypothetical protein
MDRVVIVAETLVKCHFPRLVQLAKPLPQQPVELRIRPFLRAAFYNHVCQFKFKSFLDVPLEQLVRSFFEIQ